MAARASAVAVAAAIAFPGCGDADSQPHLRSRAGAGEQPRAALCRPLRVHVTGSVGTREATELSGLVLSRTRHQVLWTHNDSGDRARLLAIGTDGRLFAEVSLAGADNVDWEDIATAPAPAEGNDLYVADIGDNRLERSEIVVYRVREPRVVGRGPTATAPAQRLTLRYPDGRHDAEALLVDPSSRALVIVTKDYAGTAGVYVANRPSSTATVTLRRVASVSLGVGEPVTGGDISANGGTIVLRTYTRAVVWSRRRGQPIVSALRRRPCRAGMLLLAEGQGEAIALTRGGRAFYTVPEGGRPALRRYAPRRHDASATSSAGS